MRNLLSYFTIPVFRTRTKFEDLFQDRKMLGLSGLILFVIGVMYTVTVYVAYRKGFIAVVEPFVNISAENYYYYETFFTVPVFFGIGILFAGTVRLSANIFGGTGTFEKNFAVLCVSMVFPIFLLMWIPESLSIFILKTQPAHGLPIPVWLDILRQSVTMLWFFGISVVGIKISENISWWKSILINFIAFIPTGLMIILFIR